VIYILPTSVKNQRAHLLRVTSGWQNADCSNESCGDV